MRIMVAPVSWSPERMAYCTGEAPRWSGEKRGVHIKDAVAGNINDLLRNDLSIGGNDNDIGSPCAYPRYCFLVA